MLVSLMRIAPKQKLRCRIRPSGPLAARPGRAKAAAPDVFAQVWTAAAGQLGDKAAPAGVRERALGRRDDDARYCPPGKATPVAVPAARFAPAF